MKSLVRRALTKLTPIPVIVETPEEQYAREVTEMFHSFSVSEQLRLHAFFITVFSDCKPAVHEFKFKSHAPAVVKAA